MIPFLKNRSTQAELMDDFSCSGTVVNQTLRELHAINSYLGGNQLSIDALSEIHKKQKQQQYSIVDLGCGGGDMLLVLDRWGQKNHVKLDLTGVDANENICQYAKNNCSDKSHIAIKAVDIFSDSFKSQQFDIVHCSLFLHHFREKEILQLFEQLKQQTRIAIIINDLHRHWVSYYFTKYILTAWSRSAMVKNDSVVSVARSFTRQELMTYVKNAGFVKYSLRWRWAFRWELVIYV